jgi:hypothetical protein
MIHQFFLKYSAASIFQTKMPVGERVSRGGDEIHPIGGHRSGGRLIDLGIGISVEVRYAVR